MPPERKAYVIKIHHTTMIYYKLKQQKINIGKLKGQTVQVAQPTRRKRISTVDFCELVADSTTFNRHEVQGVMNRMAEIARRELQRGASIEMGDFGTLSPSFSSQAVPVGTKFDPAVHITKPRVRMRLKPTFATMLEIKTKYSELKASGLCPAPSEPPHTEPAQPETPPAGGSGQNEENIGI